MIFPRYILIIAACIFFLLSEKNGGLALDVGIANVVKKLTNLWSSGRVEFSGHECQFSTRPTFKNWWVNIKAKFWCPDFVVFSGNAQERSLAEAVSAATMDFVRKAIEVGALSEDKAKFWVKSKPNSERKSPHKLKSNEDETSLKNVNDVQSIFDHLKNQKFSSENVDKFPKSKSSKNSGGMFEYNPVDLDPHTRRFGNVLNPKLTPGYYVNDIDLGLRDDSDSFKDAYFPDQIKPNPTVKDKYGSKVQNANIPVRKLDSGGTEDSILDGSYSSNPKWNFALGRDKNELGYNPLYEESQNSQPWKDFSNETNSNNLLTKGFKIVKRFFS